MAFLFSHSTYGQLPVELFAGNRAAEYSFFWDHDLDTTRKVSLFNLTFFNINYDNKSENTYEIYQIGTYNLNPNWGLAGGGRFANQQFAPQLAVSYQYESRDLYFNIFPTIQFFTQQKFVGYSLFGLLFYKPRINETWKMFNQVILEPLFNGKGHLFSYQQIRVGLEYKELFQFGLGLNMEQEGTQFKGRYNLGLFIRKELQ